MWEALSFIMHGACDLHIHAGPDVVPRCRSTLEVAQEAEKEGMKALAFKDHNTTTADRVRLASEALNSTVHLIGGTVLNYSVGGFNIEAVEKSIQLGAQIIWMPSMDSSLTIEKVHKTNETPWLKSQVKLEDPDKGLTVLNKWPDGDRIKDDVKDILKCIAEHDVILDTCHLSEHETSLLLDEAIDIGVKRIIVTHPNCSVNPMNINKQKEFIKKGAYINFAFLPCMPLFDRQDPNEIAFMIKELNGENCCLFSDFGQLVNPSPIEGYKMFIMTLLGIGLDQHLIKKIASTNPKDLLNIT